MTRLGFFLLLALIFGLSGCNQPWNNPYPSAEASANIRYSSFFTSPKTLDPARSYSNDETIFIGQIYEPPLQYHYLYRPYRLIPLTASKMPNVTYYNKAGNRLSTNTPTEQVAFSTYDIFIKPGIYYQPHPAFAKNQNGHFLYHHLTKEQLDDIGSLKDFKQTASRELIAADYVYQIKRLAAPGINSPILGLMASKIVGLSDYSLALSKFSNTTSWLDLRHYDLPGARVLSKYHYQIILKGKYPQFSYWLAMPFFAPIPWEADAFYSQKGLITKNINFNWQPVGTGPYLLAENNPNRRMVLRKNPFFHPEFYPQEGEPGDRAAGYLKAAGKRLPFIDQVVFTLEKESIPRWNKFLQGYYDQSTISSDSFDQAIQIDRLGKPTLTPELLSKKVYLQTTTTPSIVYIGFNMLDDVVGGTSERARKLRQAISIAINFEEYINIFLNGRGIPAQGPIPPSIFGYINGKKGVNPYVYDWQSNHATRKPLAIARQLLREAGYPNGLDPKTKAPLILNYDLATTGGPDEKALLAWLREQFAQIGIQLNIRNTEYNRFQEKMRLGEGQIFTWAWLADYPDPENFLFLLYSRNGKTKFGGENAANYNNPQFDQLFDLMKNRANDANRLHLINKMLAILRRDSPWIWGVYQQEFILNQSWNYPYKPNTIANNTLKYQRLNPLLRQYLRNQWNHSVLWPLGLLALLIILLSAPVFIRYWQKERVSIKDSNVSSGD